MGTVASKKRRGGCGGDMVDVARRSGVRQCAAMVICYMVPHALNPHVRSLGTGCGNV